MSETATEIHYKLFYQCVLWAARILWVFNTSQRLGQEVTITALLLGPRVCSYRFVMVCTVCSDYRFAVHSRYRFPFSDFFCSMMSSILL